MANNHAELMELILVIVLRAAERLVGILIGGLLAWLGYRLFLDVKAKADSAGNFTFPGGSAIKLTRIAPGIFFSLFGTAIVFMSFLKPVSLNQAKEDVAAVTEMKAMATTAHAEKSLSYNGAAPVGTMAPDVRESGRRILRPTIMALNSTPSLLKPDIGGDRKDEIEVELRRAKLALMKPLWSEDWGDYEAFGRWSKDPAKNPKPNATVMEFYEAQ